MRLGVLPVLLCASLGGCFVSSKPLITPETADHPFPAAAHVTSTGNFSDHELTTVDGYYVIDGPTGDRHFLVKKMGDGLYVAQECDPTKPQNPCAYALLAVDGNHVEEFDYGGEACGKAFDELQTEGLINGKDDNDDCVVDNFEKLVTIFMTLHGRGGAPDMVFTGP